ncbi:hypothetical protein [Ottowia thiooxydans]|uniref:hypothetical protein n=1 Tax=Ottowia thiooxydans TaxID=219182 RepID=UPI0012EC0F35|nr:hypothetical protein [Ottowia thiooxydans]
MSLGSEISAIAPKARARRASMHGFGTALAIAYAVWCIGVLWFQPRSPLAILSFLAPCILFACSWAWRQHRLLGAALAVLLPLGLYVIYQHNAERAELFYVAEYSTVYLTLCLWFAASLRSQPLITGVARRVHPLTPAMEIYTRKLTRSWAIYFLVMALLSIAIYVLGGLKAWGFFTLAVSPASLLGFFVIEHVLRYRWHPEFERATIGQAIRSWRGNANADHEH